MLAGLFSVAFSLCVGTAVSEELSANRDHPTVSGNASIEVGSQAFRKQTKPYFIEFRSRAAQSYGHTFAVYGRVGQKITADQVVGLHPFTESPIPWMAGHLILVPSETGASDGDTEEQYITARYRILLSEQDYRRLVTHMKHMQFDRGSFVNERKCSKPGQQTHVQFEFFFKLAFKRIFNALTGFDFSTREFP